ncbi:MAG: DNA-binding transcriptional regulator Fis [Gammaproteobacteria bacterium]|nr:DNA-binding transcriptional regulator Fis [Gammaproteobacteria bacterium]NKB65104.1 DNA-binding transcriptional regulator Fis [Gammaproteobacteria bacterium]
MDKEPGQKRGLSEHVKESVENYFESLNGEQPYGVYSMVLSEMERPLLTVVMKHCQNNQSKASKVLGINRNTLRKKLESYGLV